MTGKVLTPAEVAEQEQERLIDLFARHGVECGNCGSQIIVRGGSLGEHHALSSGPDHGDEALCGHCMGLEFYELDEKFGQKCDENARLRGLIEGMECEATCESRKRKHDPGYTHFETDSSEPCPSYHYSHGKCDCVKSKVSL